MAKAKVTPLRMLIKPAFSCAVFAMASLLAFVVLPATLRLMPSRFVLHPLLFFVPTAIVIIACWVSISRARPMTVSARLGNVLLVVGILALSLYAIGFQVKHAEYVVERLGSGIVLIGFPTGLAGSFFYFQVILRGRTKLPARRAILASALLAIGLQTLWSYWPIRHLSIRLVDMGVPTMPLGIYFGVLYLIHFLIILACLKLIVTITGFPIIKCSRFRIIVVSALVGLSVFAVYSIPPMIHGYWQYADILSNASSATIATRLMRAMLVKSPSGLSPRIEKRFRFVRGTTGRIT